MFYWIYCWPKIYNILIKIVYSMQLGKEGKEDVVQEELWFSNNKVSACLC